MHIFKVENKVVTQVWKSGKTLDKLKEVFPDTDLREGTAENGQIEVSKDVFENPPAYVKNDNELDEDTLSSMGNDFKKVILRALKEIHQSNNTIFSAKTKSEIMGFINQLKEL